MLSEEYGLHRVVHQEGVLPQQAERLDPSLPLRETELLIDVDSLNIDAASWAQIWRQASADVREVSKIIAAIVRTRGKMHNPATGSGGMLIGRVGQIGARHPASSRLRPGDRIATLVSLTLTPLFLEEIKAIDPLTERVDVRGYAILFASGQYAKLSGDLPDPVALAVLDVCGARRRWRGSPSRECGSWFWGRARAGPFPSRKRGNPSAARSRSSPSTSRPAPSRPCGSSTSA